MSAYPGEAFIAWEAFVIPPGSGAGTVGLGREDRRPRGWKRLLGGRGRQGRAL